MYAIEDFRGQANLSKPVQGKFQSAYNHLAYTNYIAKYLSESRRLFLRCLETWRSSRNILNGLFRESFNTSQKFNIDINLAFNESNSAQWDT